MKGHIDQVSLVTCVVFLHLDCHGSSVFLDRPMAMSWAQFRGSQSVNLLAIVRDTAKTVTEGRLA